MKRSKRRTSSRPVLLIVVALLLLLALVVYLEPEIAAPPSGPGPAGEPQQRPDTSAPRSGSEHLALGNPSGAAHDPGQPNNYLIVRPQYALSYSRDRGIPNWVSWHLREADMGSVERSSGPFATDTTLPDGWPRISHGDYSGSGYDRGHMTPSADRTATEADNQATFVLTNVLPQAPANNRGPWEQLESYTRSQIDLRTEAYIVAGGYGAQGTLAGGALTIPEAVWKVVVLLPAGDGDPAARVTAQTRVIAVWMPNSDEVQDRSWEDLTTTLGCIEERTGLTFLAAADPAARAALQGGGCDAGPAAAVGVSIAGIEHAPAIATEEFVQIRNGGTSAVDLGGWTLRDRADNTYTFPPFRLAPGAEVRVWTGAGQDGRQDLYWGQRQGVWNNTGGDTAVLSDKSGAEVARFAYE